MPSSFSAVSIIVPTYREAANIKPLVERTFAALERTGRQAELILVDDDSQDGTETVAEQLGARYPVRLLVRRGQRGLASAVIAGFETAQFDRFVVLDGDLQHPPEMIPVLLERLDTAGCEFVIATRYGGQATIAEKWPVVRRLGSRLATLLARPLAPLSDPMSGFFALRRDVWQRAAPLNPMGYKIALELFVKASCKTAEEVPIRFETRLSGASKLGWSVGWQYLLHLARLYWFRYPRFLRICVPVVLLIVAGIVSAVVLGHF